MNNTDDSNKNQNYLDETCFLNPKYLKKENDFNLFNNDYILDKKLKKHLSKIIVITNDAIYGNPININVSCAFKKYLIECIEYIEHEESNAVRKTKQIKEMENINEKYIMRDDMKRI